VACPLLKMWKMLAVMQAAVCNQLMTEHHRLPGVTAVRRVHSDFF
jgi:hypothetical protein